MSITTIHSVDAILHIKPVQAFLSSLRSHTTRRAYGNDLHDLLAALAISNVDDLLSLTPEAIVHYRNLLIEKGQAALTIGRKLTTVRRLFSYAMRRGWMQSNPAESQLVQSPRPMIQKRTQGLTKDEAAMLLDSIERRSLKGKRDYALILLMLHHALRRAEVAALKTTSIGTERNYVTLAIIGKNSKMRVHPVQEPVFNAILDYLKADRRRLEMDSPLFCSTRSLNALSVERIAQVVIERSKAAGISKNITCHSLRHSAITAALDGGASLRRAAQFAGHSDPKTTSSYDLDRENLDDNASHRILYR